MTTLATQPNILSLIRTDENTGRQIRQLTDLPHGAHLGYFRMFKQIPGGQILAWAKHEHGSAILLDPDSGAVTFLPHNINALKVREHDGRVWSVITKATETKVKSDRVEGRQLWHIDLPYGKPVHVCDIPDDVPGVITDVTIDGRYMILLHTEQDIVKHPIPTTKDVSTIWHFFNRPRRGEIIVYDIQTGRWQSIYKTEGICPLHLDTSPSDPGLIRFCHDMFDAYGQRVWTVRIDGSDPHAIRPQEYGELVTHEFWWADPQYIGYTYQDRRGDETLATLPWAEYSPRPTQLGLADLSGKEVYLSEPLNSYHSHLFMSPDGRFVCGEGTEVNSFVCAARFDIRTPRLKMEPMATIHTPYVPFRGQGVDCNFSADGKWLIYADKLPGTKVHQLFAVEVDL